MLSIIQVCMDDVRHKIFTYIEIFLKGQDILISQRHFSLPMLHFSMDGYLMVANM